MVSSQRFPGECHCFTGRRETCCLNGITPATEVSLHLVLALQFHLPALVSWRCSILVQTILRDGADVASMFLSFAGFAFIFFWFGSRNMFIYIYLNLFKFISERFVIFFIQY